MGRKVVSTLSDWVYIFQFWQITKEYVIQTDVSLPLKKTQQQQLNNNFCEEVIHLYAYSLHIFLQKC